MSPGLSESTPVSFAEKRNLLAQIVRLNLLDCLDETGSFDLARARHVLSGGGVQQLTIDETTRTDRAGNTIVRRKIRMRLVDKLRAIKLDDTLEATARHEDAKAEEARAKAEETARANQAAAAAHKQEQDIRQEVADRAWTAIHFGLKDSIGNLLPGITLETFTTVLDRAIGRHPRPP